VELAEAALQSAQDYVNTFEGTELGNAQREALQNVQLLKAALRVAKATEDPYKTPPRSAMSPHQTVETFKSLLVYELDKMENSR
jgi:hypothetical protein